MRSLTRSMSGEIDGCIRDPEAASGGIELEREGLRPIENDAALSCEYVSVFGLNPLHSIEACSQHKRSSRWSSSYCRLNVVAGRQSHCGRRGRLCAQKSAKS